MVLLAALALVVTRFRHSDDTLAAKEDLTFGGFVILALPFSADPHADGEHRVVNIFDLTSLPGWSTIPRRAG